MNVLTIGYFGFENNQIDGQTIKTRNFYNLLNKYNSNNKYFFFDTQKISNSKLSVLKLIFLVLISKRIFLLPGENNLNKFFTFLIFVKKIFNKELILVAIGGWLHEYIIRKKSSIKNFKFVDNYLVESEFMKHQLDQLELKNVNVFPNFRIHNFTPEIKENEVFKIVFCARICKEKGFLYLFKLAEYYMRNENKFDKKILIHFYGPIDSKDEKEFKSYISEFSFVEYKGIIQPSNVFNVLSQYDVNILPTKYEGEGFPGTIIDSYISSIPVIVSNWKYLPEFVDNNSSGYIFELDDFDGFVCLVLNLTNDVSLLNKLKLQANEKSLEFSSIKAENILKQLNII